MGYMEKHFHGLMQTRLYYGLALMKLILWSSVRVAKSVVTVSNLVQGIDVFVSFTSRAYCSS
jgi:hypothetical protein